MKNSYSLSRALLSIAAAVCGSLAALALLWLNYSVAALVIEAAAIFCLGLSMLWIAGTARLIGQAKDVCRQIVAGDDSIPQVLCPIDKRPLKGLGPPADQYKPTVDLGTQELRNNRLQKIGDLLLKCPEVSH